MKFFVFTCFLFLLFFTSCQSAQDEKAAQNDKPLFLALRICGEEGNPLIHCLLQAQDPEKLSAPVTLPQSEYVTINGTRLIADSTRYSGVFYQAELSADQFSGEHNISYTSSDGRTHSDHFSFSPFTISNDLGQEQSSTGFTLNFSGLSSAEKAVNLLITDTAFLTEDVNTLAGIKEGKLRITREMLSGLSKGPVLMQVIIEQETRLRIGRTRGKLQVSYNISREFSLY
jgi:hypothetical protein